MKEIEGTSEGQDFFEEFEFKPLSEGLGFHRKAEQIKTSIADTRLGDMQSGRIIPDRPSMMTEPAAAKPAATPASDSISKLMANLPPMKTSSLDFVEEKKTPISKTTKQVASELTRPMAAATAAPIVSDRGFRQSEFQKSLEESFSKAFPQPTVRKTKVNTARTQTAAAVETSLTPMAANLSSAIVDALTVAGISILCLVILLTITHADLFGLLNNAQTDNITQVNLVLLFLSTLQLYMLVARSFLGLTLGEWAFDTQLGSTADQTRASYPLKVAWRTLLITGTAFVLPLISMIARQDILRPLTGLQLFGRGNDQENL